MGFDMTLWDVLGRESRLIGTEAQWRYWLGEDELDRVRNYLRLTRELGGSCPCGNLLSDCSLLLGDQGILFEEETGCDCWLLVWDDLCEWKFEVTHLLRYLKLLIECRGHVQELVPNYIWALGDRDEGSVYFVRPPGGDSSELARVMSSTSTTKRPLVLVPVEENVSVITDILPKDEGLSVVSCESIFEIKEDGDIENRSKSLIDRVPAEQFATADGRRPNPIAVAWLTGETEPKKLWTRDELLSLQAAKKSFEHFVDATGKKAECSIGGPRSCREEATLTRGPCAMLLGYLLLASSNGEAVRPEDLPTTLVWAKNTRKQYFYIMRRIVEGDASGNPTRELFRALSTAQGRKQGYVFAPNTRSTYCFIFPWSEIQEELKILPELER